MKPPPESVRIGPHTYRVVPVGDAVLVDAGRCSQVDKVGLVISVDASLAPSMFADALLHECGHGLLDVLGLSEDDEERICQLLGPALLALIVDNPKLIKYVRSVAPVDR